MDDPPDEGAHVPVRIEVVVGPPDRVDQPRQPAEVAEQDAAAVAGSQRRQSQAGAAGPPAPEVAGQGQPDDVNDDRAGRRFQQAVA